MISKCDFHRIGRGNQSETWLLELSGLSEKVGNKTKLLITSRGDDTVDSDEELGIFTTFETKIFSMT